MFKNIFRLFQWRKLYKDVREEPEAVLGDTIFSILQPITLVVRGVVLGIVLICVAILIFTQADWVVWLLVPFSILLVLAQISVMLIKMFLRKVSRVAVDGLGKYTSKASRLAKDSYETNMKGKLVDVVGEGVVSKAESVAQRTVEEIERRV